MDVESYEEETERGRGSKGSKRCLQDFVNRDGGRRLADLIVCHSPSLSAFGPEVFEWRSPLRDQSYREYRDDFLRPLGLERHRDAWEYFWPAQGPQWDALAVVSTGTAAGAVLVEAKAHPAEARSGSQATAEHSVAKIRSAFAATIAHLGARVHDPAVWERGYYQLANRLAVLYFLNGVARVPAWLVLLNFEEDASHRPTPLREWRSHQAEMFRHLGIAPDSPTLTRIITLCVPPYPGDGSGGSQPQGAATVGERGRPVPSLIWTGPEGDVVVRRIRRGGKNTRIEFADGTQRVVPNGQLRAVP